MPRDSETGVILPEENPSAKVIMLLRKLTPLSIAEIKQRALEGRTITGFSCADEYGAEDEEVLLRSVKEARGELLKLGVDARIVVDGEEMDDERLGSRMQMLREIGEELEWEDEIAFAQEEVDRAVAALSDEFEEFNWWVPEDMSFLWEELKRELPAGHPLEGRDLAPMARSERSDDALFHDGEGYVLVHLTWTADNILPSPLIKEIDGDNVADFLRNDYLDG